MEKLENHIIFGGEQQVWQHQSDVLNCVMNFAIFLPEKSKQENCPVLYWLSGLTCNEQNFITKAGAQKYANEHGIVIVAPDTSPRGDFVADDDAYDLGQGAGFYVNATQEPWAKNYKMFSYVTEELPALIETHFPVTAKRSISGHSMGGHGALVCAIKKPSFYESVSAFSPICAPTKAPWGEKAFSAYLGENKEEWNAWDASMLLPKLEEKALDILVDLGSADDFLESQLMPNTLVKASENTGHNVNVNMREGYDHSYYFIASFIENHIAFHAKALA